MMSLNPFANMIWPAVYVYESFYKFWYISALTVFIEAFCFYKIIGCSFRKAIFITLIANAFSATVGLYMSGNGMMLWHLVVDSFVGGTFNTFNNIATVFIMFSLSVLFEVMLIKAIWKYQARKTLYAMIIGNSLSYGFIIIDLFLWGGWNRAL